MMSAAEHTGKLVLSVPRTGRTTVVVPPHRAPVFRRDGAYIITGGLGGLGLFLAAGMAAAGCGRIVLTARSQPNPKAQKASIVSARPEPTSRWNAATSPNRRQRRASSTLLPPPGSQCAVCCMRRRWSRTPP